MKKNTPFKWLFLMFVFSFSFATAQSGLASKNNNGSQQTSTSVQDYDGLILNDDSQSFYNQTGLVRCLTTEKTEAYQNRNANSGSEQQFEDWLAPLLQEYKRDKEARRAAGTFVRATYNIPIIFHVIYNNEAEGVGPNLSQALVDAQIEQLNLDFANLAGGATGPWATVAADTDIQFVPAAVDPNGAALAQPGINRVGGYATPLDFDGVIKPATIWDRTMYANIWTGQLGGGLLGYAQFPDNSTLPGMPGGAGGAVNTDGVVCGFGTIGSVAMPHPNGGQYAAGRTLTHEIGHWIGLRHIWGDTDCSGDDFCADTPLQAGDNTGGCANNNSCPVVTVPLDRDMSENYMDYSGDACMNVFTQDQVDRMIVVLQNSPGRVELPNSTTGNAGPSISFASTTLNQVEGSDCTFTDVTVGLNIGAAASNNAQVDFTVTNGGATQGADYELMTPSVTFSAGATAGQNMTLRIYNDSYVEGDETFTVNFTVNPNGGDATAGNDTLTFTITDDDTSINASGPVTIFEDGFETYTDFAIANVGQWTMLDNDGDATYGSDNTNFTNENYTGSFIVFNPQATTPASNAGWNARTGDKGFYCFNSNGNVSGAALNDDYAFTPQLANSTGGEIKFWAKSLTTNYNGGERFKVGVSATNDGNGITFISPGAYVVPPLTYTEYTYSIPASFNNQNLYVVIQIVSADEFVFMMDDFSVTTNVETNVQTAMNTASQSEVNLKGNGNVFNIDSTSEDIMADITIGDAMDYGCTSVAVSRSGSGAQPYNGSVAPALVMDKTFTITPSIENTTGESTVAFYVTEAELVGWETATSESRNDLQIGQLDGSTLSRVNATVTAFGANYRISGTFTTGLKGTYYFGNTALLSKETFSFDNFEMYPNPVADNLNISFTTSNDVLINLYDIRGREVQTDNFSSNGNKFSKTINLSSFSSGIYVIKIASGINTMFRKLVIK